jgi:hypothetical protein
MQVARITSIAYRLTWLAAGMLCVSGGVLMWWHLTRHGDRLTPHRPFPIVPHTIVLRGTALLEDGIRQEAFVETRAVGADGSRVLRRQGKAADGVFIARTIHLVSGKRLETDDIAEFVSTEYGRSHLDGLLSPDSDCARWHVGSSSAAGSVKGETSINSYRAVRLVRDRLTLFLAPDLGCALLGSRVVNQVDRSREVFLKELVSVVRGEPDGALFLVPETYKEVPPSVIMRLAQGSDRARAADSQYFAHQKQ